MSVNDGKSVRDVDVDSANIAVGVGVHTQLKDAAIRYKSPTIP